MIGFRMIYILKNLNMVNLKDKLKKIKHFLQVIKKWIIIILIL